MNMPESVIATSYKSVLEAANISATTLQPFSNGTNNTFNAPVSTEATSQIAPFLIGAIIVITVATYIYINVENQKKNAQCNFR